VSASFTSLSIRPSPWIARSPCNKSSTPSIEVSIKAGPIISCKYSHGHPKHQIYLSLITSQSKFLL
jgi:hypothetical protein